MASAKFCWVCSARTRGRTCAACLRELRERGCRWGAGCEAKAGHGTWGSFCKAHAAQLAAIDMKARPKGPSMASWPEKEEAPARDKTAPDKLGRLPRRARAEALGRLVQSKAGGRSRARR